MQTLYGFLGMAALALLTAADAPPAAIDLPGDRLHPENLSTTADGSAYVGSVTGGVLRVSLKSGKVESWLKPGASGSRSIFGVLADAKHNVLWTCSNDLSGFGIAVPGGEGPTSVRGFDLATGEARFSLPFPNPQAFCNDMTVAGDGTLYVTDTAASQILRWRPGAAALEVWKADPAFQPSTPFGGIDGIAFGGDGNLYVTKLGAGEIYRVAIADGAVTRIATSRPLSMPDGMRPIGGMDFLLVDEGRVNRMTIAGDKAEVITLAENLPEASGVDIFGGRAWYVQGQLSYLFDPAKRGQSPNLPFRLSSVSLGKP